MVLVAGLRRGAGGSVRVTARACGRRTRGVAARRRADLADGDESWRVGVARKHHAHGGARRRGGPGHTARRGRPGRVHGKDCHSQAAQGAVRTRQAAQAMHGRPAWSVRPYLGCPVANSALVAVHRPICMNMGRFREHRCCGRKQWTGDPGRQHQDKQSCEAAEACKRHSPTMQSAGPACQVRWQAAVFHACLTGDARGHLTILELATVGRSSAKSWSREQGTVHH